MGAVIDCVAYADGRRIGDVRIEDISEVLKQDGRFVWIDLHEPSEKLLRQVQEEFDLHDLAVEDAHRAHQRPKLEEYDGTLFVVLRTACANGENDAIVFGETHLFVGPAYVVSVRHGASLPYSEVRARCERMPHLLRTGPSFVLYALMDFIVDHFFPIADIFEAETERLEETIFDVTLSRDVTARIYNLKRDLLSVKRAVSPLIDVCNRLMRFDIGLIPADAHPYFRDVYDHVIRINESIDIMRELLASALEANLSLISVRQNDVMKKLAAWAAILAVPTMIAGIYGMNFRFMPELGWRLGYPLVMGATLAICALLYLQFKRVEWL